MDLLETCLARPLHILAPAMTYQPCPIHCFIRHHHSSEAAIALLEYLAISPSVCVAIGLDRLVPGPHVFDESPILGLFGIELDEFVAVIVWSNIERRRGFLSADEECASDDGVIGLAVHGRGTEDVLTAGLKTVEEAACEMSQSLLCSERGVSYRSGWTS